MDTNPDNLQCMALGQDATNIKISVKGWTILPSNEVKVPGVTIHKDL